MSTRRPGAAPQPSMEGPKRQGDRDRVRSSNGRPIAQPPFGIVPGTMHPTMPDGLRGFFGQGGRGGLHVPGGKSVSARSPVAVPEGAQFRAATFGNHAGSRPYKLYVPSNYHRGQLIPLIVMLHGCTQSPDDFAAGTRMNEVSRTAHLPRRISRADHLSEHAEMLELV